MASGAAAGSSGGAPTELVGPRRARLPGEYVARLAVGLACVRRVLRAYGAVTAPAKPATVAAFVEACGAKGKKPATIRRYLATIALAHRVAKLSNPCTEEPVRHALKGLTNEVSVAQRQARALGWAEIQEFLENAGESLPATRERALLCVAYDTMARRSELVALRSRGLQVPRRRVGSGADPALED